jgi:hypothetical protein
VDLRFSSIGTVGNYACGIEAETALVHCWGDNHSGALGVGDGAGIPGVANYTPVRVATGARRFRSVSVGYYSNCALEAETGLAYCWGSNESGQIGDGTADPHSTTLPTLVAGGRVRFSGIAAGGTVSCGVEAETGIGYCWGKGGSIGDGTLAQRSSPTPVGAPTAARASAASPSAARSSAGSRPTADSRTAGGTTPPARSATARRPTACFPRWSAADASGSAASA